MKNDKLKNLNSTLGEELIESGIGEVPLLGTVVSMVGYWRKEKQLERLNIFLNNIDVSVDESYLKDLQKNEQQQELFMEFVDTILHTHSRLACIALALCYKDTGLRNSMKFLISQSLNGINHDILRTFMDIMSYAHKQGDLSTVENGKTLLLSFSEIGITLPKTVENYYIQDLQSRGLCPRSHSSWSGGKPIEISTASILIYSYLEKAEKRLSSI